MLPACQDPYLLRLQCLTATRKTTLRIMSTCIRIGVCRTYSPKYSAITIPVVFTIKYNTLVRDSISYTWCARCGSNESSSTFAFLNPQIILNRPNRPTSSGACLSLVPHYQSTTLACRQQHRYVIPCLLFVRNNQFCLWSGQRTEPRTALKSMRSLDQICFFNYLRVLF